MMVTPERTTSWAWAAWLLSWMAASLWSRRAVQRPGLGAEALHWSITLTGVFLLVATHRALDGSGRQVARSPLVQTAAIQLWTVSDALGWGLFALSLAGFAFCWWARIHLGALWSGSVTVKADHRVVDTGPFALVRHPIYTGFIWAAFCMAVLRGTVVNIAGLVLIVLGFWLKARLEERFLREQLGVEAYDAYAQRTPMLVPRLGL